MAGTSDGARKGWASRKGGKGGRDLSRNSYTAAKQARDYWTKGKGKGSPFAADNIKATNQSVSTLERAARVSLMRDPKFRKKALVLARAKRQLRKRSQ